MRNTIKNIQPYAPSDSNQEIKENNLEPPSIQESQSIHDNRNVKINDLLGKMSLSIDNDGNKLGNFSTPENPVINTKKPDMYDKTSGKNEMSPYDLMPKTNMNVEIPNNTNSYTAPNKTNMNYRANESTGALGAYNNYNASYDTNNISYKPYIYYKYISFSVDCVLTTITTFLSFCFETLSKNVFSLFSNSRRVS